MPFKARARTVSGAGEKHLRLALDGEHILSEANDRAPLARDIDVRDLTQKAHVIRAEPGIEIGGAVFVQNGGIEADALILPSAVARAVRIAHFAVIFIGPCGRLGNGDPDAVVPLHRIVEIISSVCPAADVGRPHVGTQKPLRRRILRPLIDDPLAPPVGKVLCGRRPAGIIVFAIHFPAEFIVAPKDIQSPFKEVRFAVRHIFIGREIGIADYLFHM